MKTVLPIQRAYRHLDLFGNWKLEIGHSTKGFSLVEVVIGVSLIMLSLVGLTGAYSFFLKAGLKNTDSLKSAFLLSEGVEAVTLMRDDSWSTLSGIATSSWRYLAWGGGKWTATTTATTTDGIFTRTFKLDDVYRLDSGKDIVATTTAGAKTIDPYTKKLTVRVMWTNGSTTEDKEIQTYLTNLFE